MSLGPKSNACTCTTCTPLIRDTQAPKGEDRRGWGKQGKAYVFCERNGKGDCTSGEYENAPDKGCVDTKLHPDDGVMSNSTKAKGCMGEDVHAHVHVHVHAHVHVVQ